LTTEDLPVSYTTLISGLCEGKKPATIVELRPSIEGTCLTWPWNLAVWGVSRGVLRLLAYLLALVGGWLK
jgi:hypothetical protein